MAIFVILLNGASAGSNPGSGKTAARNETAEKFTMRHVSCF
jgi:hypothetical protein